MATRPNGNRDLSPDHHVARYCRPRDIANGIPRENAFVLRPNEAYLSTNWLEHCHESNRSIQVSGVHRALTGKGFRITSSGAFAVLNAGATAAACREERSLAIRLIRLGESRDPSHTGIYGYEAGDTDTARTLAQSVQEVYPAAVNLP